MIIEMSKACGGRWLAGAFVTQAVIKFCKQWLGNPSVMFAASAAFFFGNEGGAKLQISMTVFALIILCVFVRTFNSQKNILVRFLSRPATAQVLVGVLVISTGFLTLTQGPLASLTTRDWLFFACTVMNFTANLMLARNLETGFESRGVNFKQLLLTPHFWALCSCSLSAVYNNPITLLGLPLIALAMLTALYERVTLPFGLTLRGVGMPYYLNIAYNAWFAGCNLAGDHPSTLVLASCLVHSLGSYNVAVVAEAMSARGMKIPADQLVYIEIPGVVYRAPRLTDDLAYTWAPISFDAAMAR